MIVGKLQLIDNIKREIPDNATGSISPNDVRHNLLDIIDSVHLFTDDNYLDSLNFATPDTRSTKAGVDALKNLHLAGYSSTDNVAVGFAALSHNYDGFSNTAVGSYAMSCNLYGDNNTALGYQALANNVFGSGNVAIGPHAIRSNKHGSYNIAIGHGAGYYIDTNSSYNFYLGSHNLDESGVCDNTSGIGLTPLLFGDLQSPKLGVNTNTLHGYGVLQTAGAVSPSESGMYDLGHPAMRWQNIYLSDAIDYPNDRNLKVNTTAPDGGVYSVVDTVLFMTSGGKIGLGTDTPSGDYGLVTSKGSIVPHTDDAYSLGAPELRWKAGYFGDITVSGTANITTFNYTEINSCIYECRTLYLASSGACVSGEPPCGWLQDQQIEGGGFVLQSSGTDYARNYEFTFTAPDATLTCLEVDSPYSRAAWNSNISIHIASGSHLKTDRVIGHDSVALISTNDCYGLFIQGDTDNVVYLAKEDHIKPNPTSTEGKIGNVTEVNFIASGVDKDYRVSYSHLNSGITVGQRLVTRTMRKQTDTAYDPPREHIVGFSIDNIDTQDAIADRTGQRQDRLAIAAYDDTIDPLNVLTIMRSSDPGLVGVSDTSGVAHLILPETIFNIQSTGESVVRNTSWGQEEKTSLQLLSSENNPQNSLAEGVELEYSVATRRADISLWELGYSKIMISLDNDSNFIGIQTVTPNELLTLSSGIAGSAAISIEEQNSIPTATTDYGKVYVKEKTATDQTQSLYFLDDGGNEFELVTNQYDVTGGIHIYTDASGNTFAGEETPSTRDAAGAGYLRHGNTAFGNRTIFDLESGKENTAFGYHAGGNIANGSGNVFLGYNAGDAVVGGSNNIVLGHQALQTASEDLSNSIIIGGKEIGRGATSNYTFVVGADENNVLMDGRMGPSTEDRYLSVPKGEFRVTSATEVDRLVIRHEQDFFGDDKIGSIVEKVDLANDQTQGGVAFTFKGADSVVETLFTLRHDADAMSTTPSYFVPSPTRPVAELKGDLNLLGSLRFSDGTSLESTSGIITIPGTGLGGYIDSASSNEVFYLDIDGLSVASTISTPSATGTYVAVSTSDVVGKMTIGDLGSYISEGNARITICNNHILTNSSTIDTSTNCYNNIIGYRAGDGIASCDYTNFLGVEAGVNASSCDYSNFVGYRTGYGAANAAHSVFLGSSAGYEADDSQYAVFIGDSAGQFAASQRSIGIGDNALESVTGAYNIEITAGVGGSNRLIGTGAINNKIAIGAALGGDMDSKRMSIGQATINPSATLEVRAKSSDTTVRLQEWKKADGTVVAYLTQDGDLYIDGTVNSF